MVRGRRLRTPIQLVPFPRPGPGHIVARTSTGQTVVHTRRYLTCARWALSQAAPLSGLRGQ
jgi:hypothetical protein